MTEFTSRGRAQNRSVVAYGDRMLRGHTVLVVPVPELEAYAVDQVVRYDDSFRSAEPGFAHAHITLLAPWLPDPAADDLARVGKIAAAAAPFAYVLGEVRTLPGGAIHLLPDRAEPFAALTAELVAAFPQCPPYAGEFAAVPHLTLEHTSTGATSDSVRGVLGDTLPARCLAERISLQRYANHGCTTIAEWELGPD